MRRVATAAVAVLAASLAGTAAVQGAATATPATIRETVIQGGLKFGGTAGIESFTEQRWVTIQHSDRPRYPF